jgi:alpha-ketoglutarate-dependent 2,4-dichlorophenoxyacetate dioxygenase
MYVKEWRMPWTERPLTARLGIELSGLTISAGLGEDDRKAIYDATARHGVTLIRGQALGDEDIYDLATTIGDELVQIQFLKDAPPHARGVIPLRNIDADGKLLPADDWNVQQNRANELWHTDLSFQKPRATLSMLYSRIIPPDGGDTEFCDTRLLWESMSDEERAILTGLNCTHWGFHSRKKFGFTDLPQEVLDRYPPIERPLIVEHRPSGRTALTIGAYVASVVGMDTERSESLLDELVTRATVPENVYVHRWRVGDLLLWDNRCMLHRATPWDLTAHARDMRGVRLFDAAHP